MKIAEALILRSDLQTELQELKNRLRANAQVQEGEEPAEDPEELLAQLKRATDELQDIISRINLTNASVKIEGRSLTEMLAERECLSLRCGALREFLEAASDTVRRMRGSEVKLLPAVDVRALRAELDALSKSLRELDTRIQSANWLNDLI